MVENLKCPSVFKNSVSITLLAPTATGILFNYDNHCCEIL